MAPPAFPGPGGQPPFALLRPWRPISSQARPQSKAAYQRDVRRDAERAFAGRSPLEGPLYARVVYLHREPSTQDVDNILKPTLDALKGLVYADDRAILQCLAERIPSENIIISTRERPPGVVEQLLGFGPIREEAG